MKRSVGRPKNSKAPKTKLKSESEKKTARRLFRFTQKEDEDIKAAAEIIGITKTKFVRDAALEKAWEILKNT